MNVDNMAQSDYNLYNFYNSQDYSEYAANLSTASESGYGLSNVSNALNELSSINTNFYPTNVDQYVQNSYQMSQLPMYTSLGTMIDGSEDGSNGLTNIDQSASMSSMENNLGLGSNSVDLYGVLDPETSAQTDLLTSELDGTGDNNNAISS